MLSALLHAYTSSLLHLPLHYNVMLSHTPFSFCTFPLYPVYLSTSPVTLTSFPGVRFYHCVIAFNILFLLSSSFANRLTQRGILGLFVFSANAYTLSLSTLATSPTVQHYCMSFCTPSSSSTFLLYPVSLSTSLIALTSIPGVRMFHCVIAFNILCHSHY